VQGFARHAGVKRARGERRSAAGIGVGNAQLGMSPAGVRLLPVHFTSPSQEPRALQTALGIVCVSAQPFEGLVIKTAPRHAHPTVPKDRGQPAALLGWGGNVQKFLLEGGRVQWGYVGSLSMVSPPTH